MMYAGYLVHVHDCILSHAMHTMMIIAYNETKWLSGSATVFMVKPTLTDHFYFAETYFFLAGRWSGG